MGEWLAALETLMIHCMFVFYCRSREDMGEWLAALETLMILCMSLCLFSTAVPGRTWESGWLPLRL